MTGTRIFKNLVPALAALTMVSTADEIAFATGSSRLSGELRAIDAKGIAEFISPLSPEPLRIANGSILSIRFDHPAAEVSMLDCGIELTQGDILVGKIQSFDGKSLSISSPAFGMISTKRGQIRSLQFGGSSPAMTYQGPNSVKEWSMPDAKNGAMTVSNGRLSASGRAAARRDVKLAEDFTIEFRLHWTNSPQFRVFFADPLDDSGNVSDRYYIQLNAAGIEVKREATAGRRWTTLKNLDRTNERYQNNSIKVRMNVQRSTGKLSLFLNDQPEGEFLDEVAKRPIGSGMSVEFEGQNGHEQSISDIRITRFDDRVKRHKTENRGDTKTDALISRAEDRWTGELQRIELRGGKPMFLFRSKFQKDLMEVPATDISTMFFRDEENAFKNADAMCRIETTDGSKVMAGKCQFNGDSIEFDHPILGALTVPKSKVSAIKWTQAESHKNKP